MNLTATFVVFASLATSAFARHVHQETINDIHKVSSLTTEFERAITVFPESGASPTDALMVHRGVLALAFAMDRGVMDLKLIGHTHFPDFLHIANEAKTVEPTLVHALNAIVRKKPVIDRVFIPAGYDRFSMKEDLIRLRRSTSELANAFIAHIPKHLKGFIHVATSGKAELDAVFARAIAAYS